MLFFSHGRDIGALHAAETAVKDLLMSSSFELRGHAQNIAAASSLLSGHAAVTRDAEAVFLAAALHSSCNLLLGALGGRHRQQRQQALLGGSLQLISEFAFLPTHQASSPT